MADSIIFKRSSAPLAGLSPKVEAADRVPLGIAAADGWLLGGLRRDALHEAYATAREDAAGATALALLVAWLNHTQGADGNRRRAIIWVRELAGPALPYGPGLIDLGIDPQVITLLLLPDSRAVLRAALDSVRQGAAGTVLIELRGRQPLLDLTATRRLALAAQERATMVWLVRGEAQPVPSAAQTRWRVAHAASGDADAVSRPAFDLTLLRHRGGRDGLHIRMEWDRDTATFQQSFDEAADQGTLPGLVPALAAGGTSDPARGPSGGTTGFGRGDRAA